MSTPPSDEDRARSYSAPPRRRRRFSAWTILGPAAALILWVSFFSALGKSCVFKECADAKDTGSESADSGDKQNDLPGGARSKVQEGDSMGAIAAKYDLTEDELKACNPEVDPQALRPGQFLFVSAADCEGKDTATTGANPDPLAGETATGAAEVTENGTAEADPSAQEGADDDAEAAGDDA